MIWVALIILGIVAAFMFRASRPGTDIRRNGTEADAVVCRIEKERLVYASSYYHWPFCYAYYVKFTDGEGHEAEARLTNPKTQLEQGSRVRIMYLPGEENEAVLTAVTQ